MGNIEDTSTALPLFLTNGVLLKLFELYGGILFMYTLGFVNKAPEKQDTESGKTSTFITSLFGSFRNLFISTSIEKMERDYSAAIGKLNKAPSRKNMSTQTSVNPSEPSPFNKEESKDIEEGIEL